MERRSRSDWETEECNEHQYFARTNDIGIPCTVIAGNPTVIVYTLFVQHYSSGSVRQILTYNEDSPRTCAR